MLDSSDGQDLKGKIVFIRAADPGYDFLFQKESPDLLPSLAARIPIWR